MPPMTKQPLMNWQSLLARGLAALRRGAAGPLIGLIILIIVMSFLSPYFLTVSNLQNILAQVSEIGVMAVGATLVIILGGIDLSVGSVLSLSLMLTAWTFQSMHMPFGLAVVAGLAIGALFGLINGILATFARIQPFIATLATMSAAAGLALWITGGNTITGFPNWLLSLTGGKIVGLFPIEDLILLAVFGITAFWLRFRPGGRALYAIGGNEEAARLSGLPVRAAKIRAYAIAGLLAGLAGLLVMSRLDSAQPTAGGSYLLSVIAAVVIGGASLRGGKGTMIGTFVGLLIIGVVNNGLSLLNVSSYIQQVVLGIIIVAAVMTDRSRS